MPRTPRFLALFAIPGLFFAGSLAAQAPPSNPVSFSFDGGLALQSSADLTDTDGSFSVNRWFGSMGVTYAWDRRGSIGLSAGGGSSKYDFKGLDGFGDGVPWEEVNDSRITLSGRFGIGERGIVFIVPSARYNGEKDADTSEGRTYGVFAAAAWYMSKDLFIGPGIGVFSKLGDGTRVFPVLVIDWNITERWNLATGSGLASSQGAGLTLSYKLNNSWSFGLTSRYENREFRLNEDSAIPNGIGRDQSIPAILSAVWKPNKVVKMSLFAGMSFSGKLKLKDPSGETISETGYDPAAIYGGTFELKF